MEIFSKNALRVLPQLSESFLVKIVKSDKESCIVAFKSKHLSQVIAILNKLCYDYKIIRTIGVVPSLIRTFSRLGIGVGVAIATAAFVICSTFVTRVSVDGVREPALRQRVVALLEDNGVKRGGRTTAIDEDDLSHKLLALDGVAFASVKRSGGHVSVYIKEELPPAEIIEFPNAGVVAKKRAVVTRVIVDGGTAVVGYGDVVRAGDTLIAGYTEYGDNRITVEASGEVYGKLYHQKKLYFANTTLKKTYGDTKTVTKLSFFKRVPRTPACKFENYELEVRESENGFFIPYTLYTYVFREIVSLEESEGLTLDEQKRRAYSQALADINTAVKVLNVYLEVE
ncbi:MAG: sporulation protein YqfD [Clostridia bacterium]|nr:sporulation protein YqfD [Clostridia bacterium]